MDTLTIFPFILHVLSVRSACSLVLAWIKAFLLGRRQHVSSVCRVCSDYTVVGSGIPQGTVSGTILFLLYVNNLKTMHGASVTARKFADDIKLFLAHRYASEQIILQNSLVSAGDWSEDWQLQKAAKVPSSFVISDQVVPCVTSVLDLRVVID